MSGWSELSVEVAAAHAEVVSSFLFDCGSAGVEEQAVGDGVRLKAYFAAAPPVAALRD